MSVQTVTGPVDAAALGVVCPHEHLVSSIDGTYAPIPGRRPIESDPRAGEGALSLDDHDSVVRELELYRDSGGGTIVEVTLRDIGRDPEQLRTLSQKTGVHVVMGCGYYIADTHPDDLGSRTADQIAQEIIDELTDGADGTDVRAGIIGEIGTSPQPTADELKVSRAAARAQLETGAPLTFHACSATRHALDLIELLADEGLTSLDRVVFGHQDCVLDYEYSREVLASGAYCEFDLFGHAYKASEGFEMPDDSERVEMVARLCADGFVDRLLLSQDICMKRMWATRGGGGYGLISETIEPMLAEHGVDGDAVRTMRVDNPARLLDFLPD